MTSNFIKRFGTDDPRLGNLITPYLTSKECQIALVGFPHDEGVRRNGGRVGAAKGPGVVRTLLPRIGTLYNSEYNVDLTKLLVADAGDIDKNLNFDESHQGLSEKVTDLVNKGTIPFVIGGGNDQSYSNWKGLIQGLLTTRKSLDGVTVINIDAHLDVRPLTPSGEAHSGSPFRQMCEDLLFKSSGGNFLEFAAQGHQCSQEHWEYVQRQNGGEILSLSHLRNQELSISKQFAHILNDSSEIIFVSFDIDSISSADCPGVSAPASVGLTAEEAIQICFEAGKNSKVKLIDVSEFNPDIESNRTGRLVCLMFYFFLMGFAKRIETSI